jgi:murein DD-endopeptidase MepM/ murein hydrolase activator NlpD
MTKTRFRGAIPMALLAAFVAGAAIDGWLRMHGPPKPVQAEAADTFIAAPSTVKAPAQSPVSRPAPVAMTADIPAGRLRMPIDGTEIESLKGGFAETRGGERPHEAVDILAPRNTPVHAVDNGTVAKLFTSKAGGLTIYQYDAAGRLCYYYAHLERYTDGLKDGQAVAQGDVIGYVGTTGNAPQDTPHLHFAVFELNADKHWWQGRAIDPYELFRDRAKG